MISPDFTSRIYIAEVLRIKLNSTNVLDKLSKITYGPHIDDEYDEEFHLNIQRTLTKDEHKNEHISKENVNIKVRHSYIASQFRFHRAIKKIKTESNQEIEIPRVKKIQGSDRFLYDVLISQCRNHIVIAVPFYNLAEDFFLKVDRALAGSGIFYEKLNITNLVISLGYNGLVDVLFSNKSNKLQIGITRCHLVYSSREKQKKTLQNLTMSGENLGESDIYRYLIKPVINKENSSFIVTPTVLGSALFDDGVKKTSVITDKHGNFKIWISPGIRKLKRIYLLLNALETIENVVSTTSNVPILQSKSIQ